MCSKDKKKNMRKNYTSPFSLENCKKSFHANFKSTQGYVDKYI